MASGSTTAKSGAMRYLTMYHLGRLATYLIAGSLAGIAGAALATGGQWLGIQSASARVAGVIMIALGLSRLYRWLSARFQTNRPPTLPTSAAPVSGGVPTVSTRGFGSRISAFIAKTRPTVNRFPASGRAFAIGGLTTLLPCGWLYLFLLVAAGTGSIASAVMVMSAFWIGTVPALTALVLGALRMAPRLRAALPVMGALLLLVTGLYTATGRAAADMTGLAEKARGIEVLPSHAAASQTLESLADEPLPCCSANMHHE